MPLAGLPCRFTVSGSPDQLALFQTARVTGPSGEDIVFATVIRFIWHGCTFFNVIFMP